MANHHGSEGVIKSGTNVIAEVLGFSITERATYADDTPLSETAKTTHSQGITSWDGELSAQYDESDTNGQESLRPGSSVTIKVCPEGYGSGDTYLSGTCRITEKTITNRKGEMVTATFQFEGSGALTQSTV